MPASCLREPFHSLEDTQTGKRHKLYFEPGIQPWGRPRRPEDLTHEDLSATFPDNAPDQIARFWAVEVKGFAPRSLLADIRYGGARREELRRKTLEEVPAQDAARALVVETPHTIRYTQSLRHPRLQWGTRVLEVWKRQPRARYTLRINRLSSAAPEIFYVSFPLPTGSQLSRLTNGGMPFVPFADLLPGTCRDYFAIDGAAAYDTPDGYWLWVSRDVPLIALGAAPTLAFRTAPLPDVNCLQAMLFSNVWYTNFVADSHGVMEFQFDLAWSPAPQPFAPAAAAALVSEPAVLINPGLPEDPHLSRRLFQP